MLNIFLIFAILAGAAFAQARPSKQTPLAAVDCLATGANYVKKVLAAPGRRLTARVEIVAARQDGVCASVSKLSIYRRGKVLQSFVLRPEEEASAPKRNLLDPVAWSPDGNSLLTHLFIFPDGTDTTYYDTLVYSHATGKFKRLDLAKVFAAESAGSCELFFRARRFLNNREILVEIWTKDDPPACPGSRSEWAIDITNGARRPLTPPDPS